MGPADTWDKMAAYLSSLGASLPQKPKALLVISAHWEESVTTLISSANPPLLYDYSGFPPHTYELTWPAPGAPQLAERVAELLTAAGLPSATTDTRGLDHGVFIPLKLSFPKANVPTLQLSLTAGLDPSHHLAVGSALAPLREEGVFIIGSGMSYHNMRGFNHAASNIDAEKFDAWLDDCVASAERDDMLRAWKKAPAAIACHPREEHLLPLMVVAGAAGSDAGRKAFSDIVMSVRVSAYQFG